MRTAIRGLLIGLNPIVLLNALSLFGRATAAFGTHLSFCTIGIFLGETDIAFSIFIPAHRAQSFGLANR